MDITELLTFAQKNKASDLHLSAGNPPVLRVHGDMLPLKMSPLTDDQARQLLFSIMTEKQRSDYEQELELDFSLSFGDSMRFRVNAFNTMRGPAAVFRTIPTKIVSLDELGAPEILRRLADLPRGMVLVTGPTGSGKSTTLAAMVDFINANRNKHIITIEDPIEFVHRSKKSLINQREVGESTKNFSKALKSALREDPDVILVGELRDLETIQLAITAAETGHLVFGTLHTTSAPKTIDRIIDVFPAASKEMIRAMLSESLQAVITQALLKRADNSGRIAVHEIMVGTPAVRNLIREGKIPQIYSMLQTGTKFGMQTMKDAVYKLLNEGVIHQEEAKAVLASGSESMGGEGENTGAAGGQQGAGAQGGRQAAAGGSGMRSNTGF